MKLQNLVDAIEALTAAKNADIENRMMTSDEFKKVISSCSVLRYELKKLDIEVEVAA